MRKLEKGMLIKTNYSGPYRIVNIIKESLIERAKVQYGEISYCGDTQSWNECFTFDFGLIHFWFNDSAGNTHVISEDYEDKK